LTPDGFVEGRSALLVVLVAWIMMNRIFTFVVPPSAGGQRLDVFLVDQMPEVSRSRIKGLIDQGLAEVEGVRAKAGQRLKFGQNVTLIVPPVKPLELLPDSEVRFEILFQDKDLIVINKPPGLVVHPAAGHQSGTLVHGLLAVCPDLLEVGGRIRPGIVHRLDKDTSGVMVAAKNDQAHRALVDQFKGGAVQKVYLALCRGWPPVDRGEVDAPIGRHPIRRKEMSTRARLGRPALTRWEVLRRFRLGVSLVKLHLLTGRTHQIRVHLASIGFPVLGDFVYGVSAAGLKDGGGPLKEFIKRQMLHSRRLGLLHPQTGRKMVFEAPLPADMVSALEILEKNEENPPETRASVNRTCF